MEVPVIATRNIFLSLLFFSCSSNDYAWQVSEMHSSDTEYQAVRVSQKPDNIFRGLELEFTRSSSGLRSYLNNFSLTFSQHEYDTCKTAIILRSGDEEKHFLAHRLEGGQRLLVPKEAQEYLIEKLSSDYPIIIIAGRFHVKITPAEFSSHLYILLNNKNSTKLPSEQ